MTLDHAGAAWGLVRHSSVPLAQQLADRIALQIEQRGLRAGARLPSIRDMAEQAGISRFTAVEAYELLVARGKVQSRRGSGFYVTPSAPVVPEPARPATASERAQMDVHWLLRSLFQEAPAREGMSGSSGMLPGEWTDPEMLAGAMRRVARQPLGYLLGYGTPEGYVPLRQQIALMLQRDGVEVHPEHNLMVTSGVTHALDLVARHLARPGDTVLVEDPSWFVGFANLAAQGIRPIGVPRSTAGIDLERLDALAREHRPRFFLCNSVLHNPTGDTMTARMAHDILRLAERHDFMVVEDDTYADLLGGTPVRLASLDRFERVILVGGFSKMVAANLRVGYLAAAPERIVELAGIKMLAGLTSPELGERMVHTILAGGQYRRHVQRVREKVDVTRRACLARLQSLGFEVTMPPAGGLFLWADCGVDAEKLAMAAADRGLLLAPGSLFSPMQLPSSKVRFSISMMQGEQAWLRLAGALESVRA